MWGLFTSCRSSGCVAADGCALGALGASISAEEHCATVLAQPALSSGHPPDSFSKASTAATAQQTRYGRPFKECCGTTAKRGSVCEDHDKVAQMMDPVRWVFGGTEHGPVVLDDDFAALQATQLVREAITTFIRTLLRGICIEVLLDDGSVLFPETSLNYELTHLMLDVNEAQRSIPLQDVETVATPHDLRRRNILTSIQPFLDDRCCTLIIRGFEFVTFRLDTERHREYFAACLALLIARNDDAMDLKVHRIAGAASSAGTSADAGAGAAAAARAEIIAEAVGRGPLNNAEAPGPEGDGMIHTVVNC